MMNLERRKGHNKPVIRKALVELAQLPFRTFAAARAQWALNDCYRSPGPLQLATTPVGANGATSVGPLCHTLQLELEERSTHGLPPVGKLPSADLAAYSTMCEVLLRSGGEPANHHDLHKLLLFRRRHVMSDEEHFAALAKVGVSKSEWEELEHNARRSFRGAEGLSK